MSKSVLFATLVVAGLAPALARAQDMPNMTFTLARASAPECGEDCPEWIAARGLISEHTGKDFVAFLSKLDGRPRPIVIESPGGSVDAALAMGRTIRDRKLSVGVGHTNLGSPIEPGKRSNRIVEITGPRDPSAVYEGAIEADRSFCASACVFVLAAGVERFASRRAYIGVHQMKLSLDGALTRDNRISLVDDNRATARRFDPRSWEFKLAATAGLLTENLRAGGFFMQMGEDVGLVNLMQSATPEKMHFLTVDEKARTRIVTSWLDGAQPVRTRFPDIGLALSPAGAGARPGAGGSWSVSPSLRLEVKLSAQLAAPGVALTMALTGAPHAGYSLGASADGAARNRTVAADGTSLTEYLPAARFCAFAQNGVFAVRAAAPPTQAAGEIDPRAPLLQIAAADTPELPALKSAICPTAPARPQS